MCEEFTGNHAKTETIIQSIFIVYLMPLSQRKHSFSPMTAEVNEIKFSMEFCHLIGTINCGYAPILWNRILLIIMCEKMDIQSIPSAIQAN